MGKEIFKSEIIKKYQDKYGWISNTFLPEIFLNNESKNRKEMVVLVSLDNNRVTIVKRRFCKNDNKWKYSRHLEPCVVAWQPLPRNYKRVYD